MTMTRTFTRYFTVIACLILPLNPLYAAYSITIVNPAPNSSVVSGSKIDVSGSIGWDPMTESAPTSAFVTLFNSKGNVYSSSGASVGTGGGSVGYDTNNQLSVPNAASQPFTIKANGKVNGNTVVSVTDNYTTS